LINQHRFFVKNQGSALKFRKFMISSVLLKKREFFYLRPNENDYSKNKGNKPGKIFIKIRKRQRSFKIWRRNN